MISRRGRHLVAPLLLRSCNWRGPWWIFVFANSSNMEMILMMGMTFNPFSDAMLQKSESHWKESSDEGWKDFSDAFSGVWVESLLFVHRNATHTLAMLWISMSAANANGERLTVFLMVFGGVAFHWRNFRCKVHCCKKLRNTHLGWSFCSAAVRFWCLPFNDLINYLTNYLHSLSN